MASLLWGEQTDAFARKNLTQPFKRLRSLSGDQKRGEDSFFVVDRYTIQLHPDPDLRCDVLTFEARLKQVESHVHASVETCDSCRAALTEAVGLATNRLLDWVEVGQGGEQFEEWLLLKLEALSLQLQSALAALTDVAIEQRNFVDAERYARRQLAFEPWRESAHRQLMLAQSGTAGSTSDYLTRTPQHIKSGQLPDFRAGNTAD